MNPQPLTNEECKDIASDPIFQSVRKRMSLDASPTAIAASIVYVVVFMMAIPYFLWKHGYMNLLFAYVPNVDLLANVLTYRGSLLSDHATLKLYNQMPVTLAGYISTTLITYYVLLGVTYLVAYKATTEGVAVGWGDSFVVLLVTYLLPSKSVGMGMDAVYNLFENKASKDDREKARHTGKPIPSAYWPALFTGLILSLGFILLEAWILDNAAGPIRAVAARLDRLIRSKMK